MEEWAVWDLCNRFKTRKGEKFYDFSTEVWGYFDNQANSTASAHTDIGTHELVDGLSAFSPVFSL